MIAGQSDRCAGRTSAPRGVRIAVFLPVNYLDGDSVVGEAQERDDGFAGGGHLGDVKADDGRAARRMSLGCGDRAAACLARSG